MVAVNLTTGELEHKGSRYPMLAITVQEQMAQDATVQDSYWGQQGYVPWTARSPQAQRAVYRLLDGQEGEWAASSPPRSPRQLSPRGAPIWQPCHSPPSSPSAWPNVRTVDAPPPQQGSLQGQAYLTSSPAHLLSPRERVKSPASGARACTSSLSPRPRRSVSPPASPTSRYSQCSLASPRSPLSSRMVEPETPTGQQRSGSRLGLRLKKTAQLPTGMFFSTGGSLQGASPASPVNGSWLGSPPSTSQGDRALQPGSRSAGGYGSGRLMVTVDRLAKTAQGPRAAIKQRTRGGRIVDISKSAGGTAPDAMPGTTAGDWDLLLEPNRQRFMQHLDKVTHLMRLSTPPGAFLSPPGSSAGWHKVHAGDAECSATVEFELDVLPSAQQLLQQALETDVSPAAARAMLRHHGSAAKSEEPSKGKLLGRSKTFAGVDMHALANNQQLRKATSLAAHTAGSMGAEDHHTLCMSLPPVVDLHAAKTHQNSHTIAAAAAGGDDATGHTGSRLTLQQQVSPRADAEVPGRTSLHRHASRDRLQAHSTSHTPGVSSTDSILRRHASHGRTQDESHGENLGHGSSGTNSASVEVQAIHLSDPTSVAQLSVHVIPTSASHAAVAGRLSDHTDGRAGEADVCEADAVQSSPQHEPAGVHRPKPIPVEPSFAQMGAESSASAADLAADRRSMDACAIDDDDDDDDGGSDASLEDGLSPAVHSSANYQQAEVEGSTNHMHDGQNVPPGPQCHLLGHDAHHATVPLQPSSTTLAHTEAHLHMPVLEATQPASCGQLELDPLAQRPYTAGGSKQSTRVQSASQEPAQGASNLNEDNRRPHVPRTASAGGTARAAWPPVNLDESHLASQDLYTEDDPDTTNSSTTHAGRQVLEPLLTPAAGLHNPAQEVDAELEPQNPVQTSGIPYMVVRSVVAPLPSREEVEMQQRARELAELEDGLDSDRTSQATQDASRAVKALRRMAGGAAAVVGGVAAQPAASAEALSMLRMTHAQPHSSRAARTPQKERTPSPSSKKVVHQDKSSEKQPALPVIHTSSPDYRHKQGVTDIGTVQMQDIWA